MKRIKILAFFLFGIFSKNLFSQNATITIKNKTDRYVNVKLMQGPEKKAILYKTDSIPPKGSKVLDVTETGTYFTKLRAIKYDKKNPEMNDTIYSKDRPMQVISDKKRGHSNITIEFKIKESKHNDSIAITRKEYDN